MKERTREILEAGVRHYIATGEPVTSNSLFSEYDFGIRPAMIRAELSDLGKEGYFSQNHPSGGRIPTEKAYRFLVERMLENERELAAPPKVASFAESLAGELARGRARSFVEEAAEHCGLLGIGYESEVDRMYESGLTSLFSQVDIDEREDLLGIARDIEEIESRIREIGSKLLRDAEPKIYVGESPVSKSGRISVVANAFSVRGEPFFFFMIGPTRMDYGKSIRLLQAVRQSMDENK